MDCNKVIEINEVNAWIAHSKCNLSSLTKSSIGSLLALFSILYLLGPWCGLEDLKKKNNNKIKKQSK